jgi:RNA-directed DNA polymerase
MINESGYCNATANFHFSQAVSMPALYQAWRKVRANRGAAGVDAISLSEFESQLTANLQELARSLQSGAYQPLPARFVTVVKENGKERELGILTVRDRVAQRAVLDVIEPLLERHFMDCSFAFRQGRNVEMAVQRMIAARANGFWWTVESDVQDFFGSIDQRLLLQEICQLVPDEKLLALLRAWLDAGALEQAGGAGTNIWRQGREVWAGARMFVRENVNQTVDTYIAQSLGLDQEASLLTDEPLPLPPALHDDGSHSGFDLQASTQQRARRAAVKRFFQDGALLALSQRAVLGRILSAKVLGLGGLAVGAALLAPKSRGLYRQYFQTPLGTLQGAPLSPLLANFYMTPFDREFTSQGFRLIRYCDDFVAQCRTEEEAQAALRAAERCLAGRRLRLHPDKTRIVSPDGEFEFLGYGFKSNGQVEPPPSVPEQMARRIRELAYRARFRMPGIKDGGRAKS